MLHFEFHGEHSINTIRPVRDVTVVLRDQKNHLRRLTAVVEDVAIEQLSTSNGDHASARLLDSGVDQLLHSILQPLL